MCKIKHFFRINEGIDGNIRLDSAVLTFCGIRMLSYNLTRQDP